MGSVGLAPRSIVGVTSDAPFGEAPILLRDPIRIVRSRRIGQRPGLHLNFILVHEELLRKGGIELGRVL
jgi:hypothetical protein